MNFCRGSEWECSVRGWHDQIYNLEKSYWLQGGEQREAGLSISMTESWSCFFFQASQSPTGLDLQLRSCCLAWFLPIPFWGLDYISYSQLLAQVLVKVDKQTRTRFSCHLLGIPVCWLNLLHTNLLGYCSGPNLRWPHIFGQYCFDFSLSLLG